MRKGVPITSVRGGRALREPPWGARKHVLRRESCPRLPWTLLMTGRVPPVCSAGNLEHWAQAVFPKESGKDAWQASSRALGGTHWDTAKGPPIGENCLKVQRDSSRGRLCGANGSSRRKGRELHGSETESSDGLRAPWGAGTYLRYGSAVGEASSGRSLAPVGKERDASHYALMVQPI